MQLDSIIDLSENMCFTTGPARQLAANLERQIASLKNGYLQAYGYTGYGKLYDMGSVTEVACWAHSSTPASPRRSPPTCWRAIGQLYAIQAEVRGQRPDNRR